MCLVFNNHFVLIIKHNNCPFQSFIGNPLFFNPIIPQLTHVVKRITTQSFKRMIDDIENGQINAVITKDLSRLGRDYIMTGHYIEKYFPLKNIRYIAINDGIDTYTESNNDITPFKAVINDMYAKDISKKTKTALMTKKLKGEYVGSLAPYGYKKDEGNKNKLTIDEQTAVIVRRIYRTFMETQSIIGIMKQLTQEKIPTPSEAKKLKRTQRPNFKGFWSASVIRMILTNPTYTGNVTQNRAKMVSYKVHKLNKLPKEQWITIPNTHEAIVSEEDFSTVQSLLSKRNYINTKRETKTHLLTGLVVCGDCKRPMTFMTKNKNAEIYYLVCATRKKYGKLSDCTPRSIREDYLQNCVAEQIREIAQKHVDKDKVISNANTDKQTEHTANLQKEKTEIAKQLDEIKTMIASLYKDKVKNIVSEQHFIDISNEFTSQEKTLAKRLKQIEEEMSQAQENKNSMKTFEKILNDFLQFENMDRVTLIELINKIEVYREKKVIIQFNFTEP